MPIDPDVQAELDRIDARVTALSASATQQVSRLDGRIDQVRDSAQTALQRIAGVIADLRKGRVPEDRGGMLSAMLAAERLSRETIADLRWLRAERVKTNGHR